MHMKCLQFRIAVTAPHGVEQIFLFECLALIFHQQLQKVEFLCRQFDRLAVNFCRAVGEVERNAACRKNAALIFALENAFYLCKENVYIIRLFNIIICTQVKAVQLVRFIRSCTDDQYWRVRIFTQF